MPNFVIDGKMPCILPSFTLLCVSLRSSSEMCIRDSNCAVMAAQELSDYLRNGNITHSVNLPEVHRPRAGGKRICIIHKNEPGMISQMLSLIHIYESMGGVPAIREVQFSIIQNRGCFGGCNFCAIQLHQGRRVTSRSADSLSLIHI